jgi:F5/8 type C domain
MLFVLCLAVAFALAFDRLTARFARRTRGVLAALAAAIIVAEGWPSMPMAAVPTQIRSIARTDPSAAVLELPVGVTERDTSAVYRSIGSNRPLVNGYSGYVPPHYVVLVVALQREEVDALAELASDAPLIVVADRDEQFVRWSRFIERAGATVVADEGRWRIYQLAKAPRPPVRVEGAALPIRSIDPNTGADWASRMVDGDLRTEWNSKHVQAGDEEVVVDLGQARDVSAVRLDHGPFMGDFPRQLVVDCAAEGEAWQECWHGSSAALTLRAAIADPRTVALTIPIGRPAVRRLRLRQTAADPQNGWSIAELTVLGR